MVCDHGAELGVHLGDRVRSVRRGHHVERAAEDAPEAAKDERVVADEQNARLALTGSREGRGHTRRYVAAAAGFASISALACGSRKLANDRKARTALGARELVRKRNSISIQVKSRQEEVPMNEMSIEAQVIGWRIAIVRSIHGSTADGWTVDDLVLEFERMQGTLVTVEDRNGKATTLNELELRLGYERAL